MRSVKLLLLLGLTVGAADSGRLIAQQNRPLSGLLSQQDYFEIEQLVKGYTHGIDVGPEDASWVFTSDGEYFSRFTKRTTKGEKALKEMYGRLRQNHNPKQNHLLTNLVITPAAEGATGTVYLTEMQPGDKSPQGWRIKRREFHQQAPDQAPGP